MSLAAIHCQGPKNHKTMLRLQAHSMCLMDLGPTNPGRRPLVLGDMRFGRSETSLGLSLNSPPRSHFSPSVVRCTVGEQTRS